MMNNFGLKKRILLIEPPFYRLFGYKRWYYPATLTFVGSYLEKQGHYVRIFDADQPTDNCKVLSRVEARNKYYQYENALDDDTHPVWSEISKVIAEFKPDIVGLTSITAKIDSANKVAAIARKIWGKRIKIVIGGPHVQGMLTMYSDYNFGDVYDEAVPHIPNLINQAPNKELIMDIEKYANRDLSCIITSMGCPNCCTFCCHSYERKIVYRNLDSVREELIIEKERPGPEAPIYIMDDCCLSNSSRFDKLCKMFKDLGLKFTVSARIMALTPQKITQFIDSGGMHLNVGLESGSQRTLDRVKKRLEIKEVVERTKLLNDLNLSWTTFLIVGFPFEKIDDLKATEEIVKAIKPTYASINRFSPYPGTEIYKEFFLDSNIRFRDIFQLNPKSCVKLSEENENYIDYLFSFFEEYNNNNLKKNKYLKSKANENEELPS